MAAARPRGPVRPGPARSMAKHHRTPARSAEPVIEVKSKVSARRRRRRGRDRGRFRRVTTGRAAPAPGSTRGTAPRAGERRGSRAVPALGKK